MFQVSKAYEKILKKTEKPEICELEKPGEFVRIKILFAGIWPGILPCAQILRPNKL